MDEFSFKPMNGDDSAESIPLLIHPARSVGLAAGLGRTREWWTAQLARCGALLFRNFDVGGQATFESVVRAIAPRPLNYTYRSTPRTHVSDGIYTATEYPAHQRIPLHNENAYQDRWPMILIFYCQQPSTTGGETPLARSANVTARLDRVCVARFREKGVLYVRNYGHGIDLPWQTVFQTEDRSQVESFCDDRGIRFSWHGDTLRTEQVRPALARHPGNGQELWFNQAHLFHSSALDAQTRAAMRSIYKESELPRNAYFGDGSPLDEEMLGHIRDTYERETVTFSWQAGDVLVLDNMLICHGRNSYSGPRRILLAMGESSSEAGHARCDSLASPLNGLLAR